MNKESKNQSKSLSAFKKAQSLLAKIVEMKEANRYCVDIMQQNLAVIGLLKSANQELLADHLNSCFKAVMNSSNTAKQKQMIEEILQLNKLSLK